MAQSTRPRPAVMHAVQTTAKAGLLCLALLGAVVGATGDTGGFSETFDAPTLGAAWQVVQYGGPRVYGYTSPANHFSLTDRPGALRYLLDPMTHYDGYLNGFQPTYRYHSDYDHDPGLELRRSFTGQHWQFDAQMASYMPYTNGRVLGVRVYFGDGTAPTVVARFERGRDVNVHYYRVTFAQQEGTSLGDVRILDEVLIPLSLYGADELTVSWRLQRLGGVLTALWSEDAQQWHEALRYDFVGALESLEQQVVLTGLSWFNTYNSYADWEFIRVIHACDVNADLTIDSRDAVELVRALRHGTAVAGYADCDGNGSVTWRDVLAILAAISAGSAGR